MDQTQLIAPLLIAGISGALLTLASGTFIITLLRGYEPRIDNDIVKNHQFERYVRTPIFIVVLIFLLSEFPLFMAFAYGFNLIYVQLAYNLTIVAFTLVWFFVLALLLDRGTIFTEINNRSAESP